MAKWGKCDFRQFDKLQKKIDRLAKADFEVFCADCAKELAARILAQVIQATPGRIPGRTTGTLRAGWTAQLSQGFEVTKSGNAVEVELVNDTYYASYVEFGHRTRNHKGWVQGRFYLTISVEEVERASPQILERKLDKYLKRCFDG